jgi:hypothetical protein
MPSLLQACLQVNFALLERSISLLIAIVALTRFTSGVSRHHRAQYSTSFVTHVKAGDTRTKALHLQRCGAVKHVYYDVYAS